MARFIARNIIRFALLMAAVSFVVFALVSLSPIDPVQANVGQAAYANMSEAKRVQLAEYWGTGTPLLQRYANWLGALVTGDMGTSLRFNAPVVQVIAERAGNSFLLMSVAWVASGVIGFALGVAAGVRRGGWLDRAVRVYCYALSATPSFWIGLVLLTVFAVQLGWFPLGMAVSVGAAAGQTSLSDVLSHLALPAITLSLTGVANIALHTREKTVDIMEGDFVRYARTRGEGTTQIVRHHVLRNVALPAITLQCSLISEIFGGSVLVEQVFSYPGLGQAAVTAGLGSDAALLAGIALVSAALVFGGNTLANILYGVVDPRMRSRETHGKRDDSGRGAGAGCEFAADRAMSEGALSAGKVA